MLPVIADHATSLIVSYYSYTPPHSSHTQQLRKIIHLSLPEVHAMKNTTCDDAAFGPVIDGCRPFDFTIAFELYIFSVIPSAIFLLVVPLRLVLLSRLRVKVEGLLFRSFKLVSTIAREDS